MTKLPKGWRGKKGERGVYVRTGSVYAVERDVHGLWRGYVSKSPRTGGYHKAIEAMAAVDRLIKEEHDRSV